MVPFVKEMVHPKKWSPLTLHSMRVKSMGTIPLTLVNYMSVLSVNMVR